MPTENQKKHSREYWKRKNSKHPWYLWREHQKPPSESYLKMKDYRYPRTEGTKEQVRIAERYIWIQKQLIPCTVCGRKARKRIDGSLHHPVDWYPKDGSQRALAWQIRAGWSVEALEHELARCDPYCLTCWNKRVWHDRAK